MTSVFMHNLLPEPLFTLFFCFFTVAVTLHQPNTVMVIGWTRTWVLPLVVLWWRPTKKTTTHPQDSPATGSILCRCPVDKIQIKIVGHSGRVGEQQTTFRMRTLQITTEVLFVFETLTDTQPAHIIGILVSLIIERILIITTILVRQVDATGIHTDNRALQITISSQMRMGCIQIHFHLIMYTYKELCFKRFYHMIGCSAMKSRS